MLHKLSRRSLFIGAASIIAAPAVIRVARLMPIKPFLAYERKRFGLGYSIVKKEVWGTQYPMNKKVIVKETLLYLDDQLMHGANIEFLNHAWNNFAEYDYWEKISLTQGFQGWAITTYPEAWVFNPASAQEALAAS